MEASPLRLSYDAGTLIVVGGAPALLAQLPGVRPDPRTGQHRAEGRCYRAVVEFLRSKRVPYADDARSWQPTPWPMKSEREPFPHQAEALEAWWSTGGRGVVVLP